MDNPMIKPLSRLIASPKNFTHYYKEYLSPRLGKGFHHGWLFVVTRGVIDVLLFPLGQRSRWKTKYCITYSHKWGWHPIELKNGLVMDPNPNKIIMEFWRVNFFPRLWCLTEGISVRGDISPRLGDPAVGNSMFFKIFF